MDVSLELILICGIIIIAYIIDILAKKARIPAVVFLSLLGILLRQVSDQCRLTVSDFRAIIPVLGTFSLTLLFLNIPREFKLPAVNTGILFIVVLISSLMMLLGREEAEKKSGFEKRQGLEALKPGDEEAGP